MVIKRRWNSVITISKGARKMIEDWLIGGAMGIATYVIGKLIYSDFKGRSRILDHFFCEYKKENYE